MTFWHPKLIYAYLPSVLVDEQCDNILSLLQNIVAGEESIYKQLLLAHRNAEVRLYCISWYKHAKRDSKPLEELLDAIEHLWDGGAYPDTVPSLRHNCLNTWQNYSKLLSDFLLLKSYAACGIIGYEDVDRVADVLFKTPIERHLMEEEALNALGTGA